MQCELNSTSSLLSHIRFLSAVWVASKGTAHPVTHIPQWFPSLSNYVSVLIETLLVTEEKDLRTSSTTYNFCVVRDRCIYFVTKNTATENIAYKCNFFWILWPSWTGSFSKTSGNIRFALQSKWGKQKGRNNDIRPLWHNRVLCAHNAIVKLCTSQWRLLFEGKIHIFGAHSAKKIHMKNINTVSYSRVLQIVHTPRWKKFHWGTSFFQAKCHLDLSYLTYIFNVSIH